MDYDLNFFSKDPRKPVFCTLDDNGVETNLTRKVGEGNICIEGTYCTFVKKYNKMACMDNTTAIGRIVETIFDGSCINCLGRPEIVNPFQLKCRII